MFADKTVAEPASLTITEAVTALSNGQLKILDLLRSCQDRIQRFNNRFRAFSHLASFSTAEIDALQAEFRRGKARSPLHGLTIGVKGSIPVASPQQTLRSYPVRGRPARSFLEPPRFRNSRCTAYATHSSRWGSIPGVRSERLVA